MNTATTASELFSQALGLPIEERETLALQLLASIPAEDDGPPRRPDAELAQVIERRIAERDAGQAKTIDVSTFAARVRDAARSSRAS
jgi:putative addiction module component (TIGR02574 family)